MKRAVVLAGGVGSRLAPYTTVLPKPLMPVGDMSILEVVIRQLAHFGFSDITLAVGYLSELIMAVCGDGSRWGVHIRYSLEERPLGTAGPLTLLDPPDSPFLVMNGDVLTTLDFAELYRQHHETGALITVATTEREVQIELGVLELDSQRRVTNYIEKPKFEYQVSMGIYVMDPAVLGHMPPGTRIDLPDLVRATAPLGRVQAYRFHGYWRDIGNRSDYESAIADFDRMRARFLPAAQREEVRL